MTGRDETMINGSAMRIGSIGLSNDRIGWGIVVVAFTLLWFICEYLAKLFQVAPHTSACYPADALAVAYFLVFGLRFREYLIIQIVIHICLWANNDFNGLWTIIQTLRHQLVYGGAGIILLLYFGIQVPFNTNRDVFLFSLGSIIASIVSAIIAALFFKAYHLVDGSGFFGVITSFWIGDLTGLIVFCPVIIHLFLIIRKRFLNNHTLVLQPITVSRLLVPVGITTACLLVVKILPDFLALKENALLLMVVPITFVGLRYGCLTAITITAYANILLGIANLFCPSRLGVTDLQMFMLSTGITALFVGILADESRRSEKALRNSLDRVRQLARQNNLFAAAVQASPSPICVVDVEHPEMPVRFVNQAYERMTGFASRHIVGCPVKQALAAEDAVMNRLRHRIAEQQTFSLRQISRTAWGSDFVQIIHFAPVYDEASLCVAYVGLHEDITEKMLREGAEREREKLVSLGNLAGGIAHELNNILHPVLNFVKIVRKIGQSDPQEADQYLEMAQQSVVKAGEVVHKVLVYVRRDISEPGTVLFSGAFQEALDLARTRVPPTITIREAITTDDHHITIGRTELTQVVMNLVVNAVHALGQNGQITLDAVILDLPEPMVGKVMLAAGRYVRLTVSDTGPGIPPDVQSRIFEPFFTTKAAGEGTGLGLSVVHSILTSNNGAITVDSVPGQGASFTAYLPVAAADGNNGRIGQ